MIHEEKNFKKPQIYKNGLLKIFAEWFSIRTVDPICFIKMLWLSRSSRLGRLSRLSRLVDRVDRVDQMDRI